MSRLLSSPKKKKIKHEREEGVKGGGEEGRKQSFKRNVVTTANTFQKIIAS